MTNLQPIFNLFNAVRNLQYPKVHLVTSTGVVVVIRRNGARSRYPGTLAITDDRPFGSNRYFGKIELNGTFSPSRDRDGSVNAILSALASDPVGTITSQGHLTGSCCLCQRTLTDARSLEAGYGPVCATNWNLPWGAKLELAATSEAPAPAPKATEDVAAYDQLIASEDLRVRVATRVGQCVIADLRMAVLMADVATEPAPNAPITAPLIAPVAEAVVNVPAVPEVVTRHDVPLTQVRVQAVPMAALAINVPEVAEVKSSPVPLVTDVRVLDLEVLRAELRKVSAQFRRGGRS